MPPEVRPATVADVEAPALLYASSAPYYDAFAGSQAAALRLLAAVWDVDGHTASAAVTQVAVDDGHVVGVLAAFDAGRADALARGFLRAAVPRLPVRRWPAVVRHLRASGRMLPAPPGDALYVDALAVAPDVRRRGIATALLERADELARAAGLGRVALDTGLENTAGRALYPALGFRQTALRRAPDERTATLVGGRGFVSFVRPV